MTIDTRLLALALILSACGSAPAATRQPAATPSDQPGALDRAYIYEVQPEQEAPSRERSTVEVSGTAQVDVPADRGRASFAVESRAASAGEASAANADAMSSVTAALRESGIRGLDIETFGYTLRPEYRVGDQRVREIDGYTALNNVRVTVEDVTAVGRLIDVAIGAGANRVTGLAFEASDTEAARLEALRLAVQKATAEAEAIASALGRELGEPLEVRGGAEAPRRRVPVMFDRMEAARAAPTPIEPGEQTVQATVTITFALGPARSGR